MLNKKGFTLIEVIITVTIFVIFIVLSTNFVINGLKMTRYSDEQETAVKNTRDVLNSMVAEIRESAQSDTGDYLLDVVEPQEFSFYSDVDSDTYAEKIRYFIDGLELKKGIIQATGTPLEYPASEEVISVIADYINNQSDPIFSYYNKNYTVVASSTADKDDIRLIHVFLKINVTPEIMPADYLMNMDIQIRNLKDNL